MDGYLIAPTSALIWQVSGCLDDRIEGQRSLLDPRGRNLILPQRELFHPKRESLAWREDHLLGHSDRALTGA